MTEPVFPHIDHTALSDKVYAILREKILKRELRPGEKVQIDEIACQLGVSRTPVKDAVNRLALEGLVKVVARRGTFVTELTQRDVSELFALRLILEQHAAERLLAEDRTEQVLAELEACIANMDQAICGDEYRDYEGFIAWDSELHMRLVALTDNQRLIQTYQGLSIHAQIARAHYLQSVEGARQAQQEHKAIYRAFENKDTADVERALAAHINNVKDGVLQSLAAQSA